MKNNVLKQQHSQNVVAFTYVRHQEELQSSNV